MGAKRSRFDQDEPARDAVISSLDACLESGVNGVVAKSIDKVALLAKLGGSLKGTNS